MPFTAQELQDAQKSTLDFYLKNTPVDQVSVERPILKDLMAGKKSFPGGKQYVIEQLRFRYQSNFQWFNGAQSVTYNRRQTLEQCQYPWRSAHDGYAIDEDRLAQNGITMHEGSSGQASQAERIQLVNLLEEQNSALRSGFEEKFSAACVLDGSGSADAIAGIDAIVSMTPNVGVVGGIDSATNTWWRNGAYTGLTIGAAGNILTRMEIAWRDCVRNGGKPDRIYVGWAFLEAYRDHLLKNASIQYAGGKAISADGGTDKLYFKGVPLEWVAEFDDDFGGAVSPTTPFTKRCYFINRKHLTLRPMESQDMITRKPPRHYSKYEYYVAITWRGSLTCNRRNAHAVLSIA